MTIENSGVFDFSKDAAEFRKKLARQIQEAAAARIVPLADDELSLVNAAGVPVRAPEENQPS